MAEAGDGGLTEPTIRRLRRVQRVDVAEVVRRSAIREKADLLLESQRWPVGRREHWVEAALDRLAAAARKTPFWSARLQEADGLEGLAPIDRETLRFEFERMRPPGDAPVLRAITSGSTGTPVQVLNGAESFGFGMAARRRQQAWFGLPPRAQPEAGLAISARAEDPLVRRTVDQPPTFAINPWKLAAHTLAEVHGRLLAAAGVRVVEGTSSQLAEWAELYRRSGTDARDLGVRMALMGGEMVHLEQRKLVEGVFDCPVTSMYGAMEARAVASECPAGSLHVNEEHVRVEILRPDGTPAEPGERGEVVVTPFHNVELPLIRYRLGDVAAWSAEPCPCGLDLRRLEIQLGRLEEHVVRRDGGLVHPRFLRTIYEAEFGNDLVAFHTVQDAPGSFTARLELERPPPASVAERLGSAIEDYLGEPVTVEISLEPGLARERLRSGKLRTFINRVA
jgi:phenylacetate-CoA ligase